MIQDNFDKIRSYIEKTYLPDENNFYFCQIIQRKKDFDGTDCPFTGNNRVIKSYYITNIDWFKYKRDEIIRFCDNNNARAMININPKSMKSLCLAMLKELAQFAYDSNYSACLNVRDSAACTIGCAIKNKKVWVVDVDDCKDEQSDYVKNIIDTINRILPIDNNKVVDIIPTVSGLHLITKPFNCYEFTQEIKKNIDIHKNNPTLLYANTKNNSQYAIRE